MSLSCLPVGEADPSSVASGGIERGSVLPRYLLGQGESHAAAIEQHRDLLLANLPAMEGGRIPDLAYVFYGTFALHQEKAKSQEIWNEALRATLLGALGGYSTR